VETADFAEQREDLLDLIAQDEEEVRIALHELTDAAEQKFDVSERIRQAPLAWAVGAFLVGAWLGSGREHYVGADRPRS
jgi:hypothetical protein